MLQIRKVSIKDVFPVEDEYGNLYLSRDFSQQVNKDYVKALADTFRDGEPDTPPLLVEDGGIYRIKDGYCRIEAMRLLNTRSFTALVELNGGDLAVDEVVADTVVRTNAKKKYEALEESRFVQQLALMRDDEYVSHASGIEKDKVARIRRAAQVAGDEADQMSIDRLLALEEFSDDPSAVEVLMDISERDFPSLYSRMVRERERKETRAKVRTALVEKGVELVDERPGQGYRFLKSVWDADMVPSDVPEGCIAVEPDKRNPNDLIYLVYAPTTEEIDPEEQHHDEWRAQEKGLIALDYESRLSWLVDAVEGAEPRRNLKEIGREWVNGLLEDALEDDLLAMLGEYLWCSTGDMLMGIIRHDGWNEEQGPYNWSFDSLLRADEYLELLGAFIDDGYEPTEHEQRLYEKCEEDGNE